MRSAPFLSSTVTLQKGSLIKIRSIRLLRTSSTCLITTRCKGRIVTLCSTISGSCAISGPSAKSPPR